MSFTSSAHLWNLQDILYEPRWDVNTQYKPHLNVTRAQTPADTAFDIVSKCGYMMEQSALKKRLYVQAECTDGWLG